ncbi:exosortase system-associated protein, TIGR04073 family [bacterium]|nr:exosortase system-associated protein, TIGR04073 family [bacterium]
MKLTKYVGLAALAFVLMTGASFAQNVNYERNQSDAGKMFHKLGRGVVNVVTCWVEIPRSITIQWENTDPVSGLFVGGIEGIGWGFARFATGVYEVFTFPFPVPSGFKPLIEPEFVITDIWGADIPYVTDFRSNDPEYPSKAPIYPQRFSY